MEDKNIEEISGIIGEVDKKILFFELQWVEKVYLPSEFKRLYTAAPDNRVKAKVLFAKSRVKPTDEERIVLLNIDGNVSGIVLDSVIHVINNEKLRKTPLRSKPAGHKHLIFNAILMFSRKQALCFSKEGLKKLISN